MTIIQPFNRERNIVDWFQFRPWNRDNAQRYEAGARLERSIVLGTVRDLVPATLITGLTANSFCWATASYKLRTTILFIAYQLFSVHCIFYYLLLSNWSLCLWFGLHFRSSVCLCRRPFGHSDFAFAVLTGRGTQTHISHCERPFPSLATMSDCLFIIVVARSFIAIVSASLHLYEPKTSVWWWWWCCRCTYGADSKRHGGLLLRNHLDRTQPTNESNYKNAPSVHINNFAGRSFLAICCFCFWFGLLRTSQAFNARFINIIIFILYVVYSIRPRCMWWLRRLCLCVCV